MPIFETNKLLLQEITVDTNNGGTPESGAEFHNAIFIKIKPVRLNRKRISEICQGIIDRQLKFNWGCEGLVDSVTADQFPIMVRANCNFLAFGIEAGTQKVLDRLKKMQTLEQVKRTVGEAKRHGIDTTHGFFLTGSLGESEEDILESFRFAARLKLDTFGFNRLCAYRGTPLWKEYVARGIIDDARDWNKWLQLLHIYSFLHPLINPALDILTHNKVNIEHDIITKGTFSWTSPT